MGVWTTRSSTASPSRRVLNRGSVRQDTNGHRANDRVRGRARHCFGSDMALRGRQRHGSARWQVVVPRAPLHVADEGCTDSDFPSRRQSPRQFASQIAVHLSEWRGTRDAAMGGFWARAPFPDLALALDWHAYICQPKVSP
jgi:hypothetical protein